MFIIIVLLALKTTADTFFNAEMSMQLEHIGQLNVAPNGQYAAYVQKHWIRSENSAKSVLHIVYPQNGTNIALKSEEPWSIGEFCWAPDSRHIAFTKSDDGHKDIYLLNVIQPTAPPLRFASFSQPISNLKWSSKGGIFLFSAHVYPGLTMNETQEFDEIKAQSPSDVLSFDRLPVYLWDEYSTSKVSHLFYTRVNYSKGGYQMDSDAIDVMGSFLGDCPFKPYGNSDSFSVSPNDDVIAYATQSREVQAQSVRMHIYIYQIPEISQFGLKDEKNIHNQKNNTVLPQLCLTNGQRGIHAMPIFSPSGRFLAYLATESDIDYKGIMKIIIYDFYTREQRILCKDWDSSPESLHWSSHASDKLFVIAEVFAQDRIFSIDVISGKRSQAFPLESSASSVKLLNSTTLIYLRSSFIDTPNIYAINWFDAETKALINEKKLTDVNHEAFSSLTYQLQTPNELEVASVDGSSIHCRFFPPAGNQPTQKASVPLVVWVHGGPESSWNNEWNDRWNPQIFAQAGFALLLPDIHGSTSYGSKFQKAILGNWSGIALDDVISARKKVLQNYEYLDENRTAAMGGSFGGYMMNLIQMQETLEKNPFVCIVCHDPVFDVAQSAFESDILFFIHEEHGSSAWTDRNAEDKHSPTKQSGLRLEKIHTPQLTFQGGRDFRCSRGQGFGAFTVLQRLGVKSRLVFFPSENHWVLNPANVIEWNNEALSWLKDNVEDKEQAENTMKRKLELLQYVL